MKAALIAINFNNDEIAPMFFDGEDCITMAWAAYQDSKNRYPEMLFYIGADDEALKVKPLDAGLPPITALNQTVIYTQMTNEDKPVDANLIISVQPSREIQRPRRGSIPDPGLAKKDKFP